MKVLQWRGTESSQWAMCEDSVDSLSQDLLAEVKQARSKLIEEVLIILQSSCVFMINISKNRWRCIATKP